MNGSALVIVASTSPRFASINVLYIATTLVNSFNRAFPASVVHKVVVITELFFSCKISSIIDDLSLVGNNNLSYELPSPDADRSWVVSTSIAQQQR